MGRTDTNHHDTQTVALQALVWTLGDEARAGRLVALTGLTPGDLRARLQEPAVLAACLAFLEAHEPDLIACADAIDCKPTALIHAHKALTA